jgi:ABC-type Na+ efflux pump permease subunit
MNPHHVLVLARDELGRSLAGTRGVLFLILYGCLWFWVLWRLSGGWAAILASEQGLEIMSWALDPALAKALFAERSPTMGLFYLMFMSLIPVFTLWGAGDQTATDIGTRHLRYLVPRCGRAEIYVGRFLGAFAFMLIVNAVVVAAGVAMVAGLDRRPDTFTYGFQILAVSLLYTLPFVALMSLFGAMLASAAAAILTAVAAYTIVGIAGSLMALHWPAAEYVTWVFPSPLKGALLTGHGADFLLALALLPLYAAAYFALGWLVFRRRDL